MHNFQNSEKRKSEALSSHASSIVSFATVYIRFELNQNGGFCLNQFDNLFIFSARQLIRILYFPFEINRPEIPTKSFQTVHIYIPILARQTDAQRANKQYIEYTIQFRQFYFAAKFFNLRTRKVSIKINHCFISFACIRCRCFPLFALVFSSLLL